MLLHVKICRSIAITLGDDQHTKLRDAVRTQGTYKKFHPQQELNISIKLKRRATLGVMQ